MKKILVIDGNSIINRAFYGVRPLSTKSGKPTNAIFGMINIISRQLNAVKPDYAAVAFDLKIPTFRHKMYDGYKQGRHPTPEDLLLQFDDAKECLSLMGLKILELPGYEADDIQGTIATMAHTSSEDCEAYVLSGDRDLLQLIDDKITVLLASNSDTSPVREPEFYEKYGISPKAFVDMKALMGDSSDNIPGVAGVGEKTAGNLIRLFGSLDGIYENIDSPDISKGVREKLVRDKENAYLSKTLAKIETNAPVGLTLEDIAYTGIDKCGLYKKFSELELSSLIVKFGLTGEEVKRDCCCEAEKADFKEVCAQELVSKSGKRFAVSIKDEFVYLYNKIETNMVFSGDFSVLSEVFKNAEVICFDAKSLIHTLKSRGVKIGESTKFLDLMLYAYLLNPGGSDASPENLSSEFLSKSIPLGEPSPEIIYELEEVLLSKIEELGMKKLLTEIELPLAPILAEMESVGFKIDTAGMLEYAEALEELADGLKRTIYIRAGGEFNINSPKQLGEVLFVKLGLPYKKKTKSGFSTDAQTLEELRAYSPIIDDILEYRQVTKLIGTYAAAMPSLADENGRIHTTFRQALTATGRLSSQDPNLQNIPIKTKMGRQMRKYFIAEEGYTLVDADYSQIELRLLAHISDDYTMREAFLAGADIHRKTASAVFGVPEDAVTEEMRKRAKAVNFGIVYGISGFSLAKDIGTTTKEASNYIKSYHLNYLGIDAYLERVVKEAEENGYTVTPMGRRRYIPELSSSNGMQRAFGKRVAMNAPIQGAAADIMKLAMIRAYNSLKAELPEARLVMQVHDELIVEVPDSKVNACKEILQREMEGAAELSVPLTVDVTSGKNWLDQE